MGKHITKVKKVELSENAKQVLTKRYLRKGEDGTPIENIEEMFWRVASHVAKPETKFGYDPNQIAETYYDLMTSKRFFPNSPRIHRSRNTSRAISSLFCASFE